MESARNGEVALAYELSGPADGRPLLLLGGTGGQIVHVPQGFLAALGAAGFRIVTMDNRDAGRSTHLPGGKYTLADMADDAVAVLDALGWTSAHLFGVSLGGMIGQVLAVRHPDRVRSLTSVASAPGAGWRLSRPKVRTVLRVVKLSRKAAPGREGAAQLGDQRADRFTALSAG